jgi:hypothetical protein
MDEWEELRRRKKRKEGREKRTETTAVDDGCGLSENVKKEKNRGLIRESRPTDRPRIAAPAEHVLWDVLEIPPRSKSGPGVGKTSEKSRAWRVMTRWSE